MGDPFVPVPEPQVCANLTLGEGVLKSTVPFQQLAATPLATQTVKDASVSCQPKAERQEEKGGPAQPSQAAVESFESSAMVGDLAAFEVKQRFGHSLLGHLETAEKSLCTIEFTPFVPEKEFFYPQLKDFKDPVDMFIVFQKRFCNANVCVEKKWDLVGLLQNFSPRKQCGYVMSKSVFRFDWDSILPHLCVQNLLGILVEIYSRSPEFVSDQPAFGKLLENPLSMLRGRWEGLEEVELIFSKSWPEHLKHVQRALAQLQDCKMQT